MLLPGAPPMMFKFTFSTALIATLFLTTACSDSKPKSPSAIRHVTGDPYVFVKGTQMDNKIGLPMALIQGNEKWDMVPVAYLEEPLKKIDDIVAEQSPERARAIATRISMTETVEESEPEFHYNFKREPLKVVLEPSSTSLSQFEFKLINDRLILDAVRVGETNLMDLPSFRLLHYSSRPDLSAFSLLFYASDSSGKVLMSLYFIRRPLQEVNIKRNDKYNYFFGPGMGIAWDTVRPLEIQTCNLSSKPARKVIGSAIERWNEVLNGSMTLTSTHKDSCPPFSDLNTHTISYIDDWIEVKGEPGVLGETSVVAQLGSGKIIESDMFLLRSEINEHLRLDKTTDDVNDPWVINIPVVREFMYSTVLHEVGHMLGLHHIFDGTPSIMAYDDSITDLEKYDIEAIQELYSPKNHTVSGRTPYRNSETTIHL